MSYKSHRSAPGRVFDHLYDPIYTTSGFKDVWRQNCTALTISAPIDIFPVYRTMFTDLPRRPRNAYIMKRNPLPHDNHPFYHLHPSATTTTTDRLPIISVGGQDRAKFFCNALTNEKTINLKLDKTRKIKDCHCVGGDNGVLPPLFASIACQTMYREQSAQTKPWMPNAIIGERCPGTPEIVYVADLLSADTEGTPPGRHEVEIVERARKRRQWERSLPPIATFTDWDRRRVVMEAFEWEEWLGREHQIEYCQSLRMAIVERMMAARKRKISHDSNVRLEETARRLEAQKDERLKKIRLISPNRLLINTIYIVHFTALNMNDV